MHFGFHSDSKELDQRTLVGYGPGAPTDLHSKNTCDKAGNLRTGDRQCGTKNIDWTYTRDACNRLVKIESENVTGYLSAKVACPFSSCPLFFPLLPRVGAIHRKFEYHFQILYKDKYSDIIKC